MRVLFSVQNRERGRPDCRQGGRVNELYRLVDVMKRLRSPGGCPWDREQTHESLKPYLLEEAYEVLAAIDTKDDEELKEELGDLLLQIVFHAQLADEEHRFSIDDVAESIVKKLIRRHPHVFSEVKVNGSEEVLRNWEKIKKDEGKKSALAGVPPTLPALLKARRVQEKAKRVGFDWDNAQGAFEKVVEEVNELKQAVAEGKKGTVENELGDLLFSIVNVSRFLDVDAEDALRKTINKFMARFRFIEEKIEKNGKKSIENHTLGELDLLWEKAKHEQE
jgi:tetrapyrrole methylase family protein/MazG family protein